MVKVNCTKYIICLLIVHLTLKEVMDQQLKWKKMIIERLPVAECLVKLESIVKNKNR